MLSVARNMRVHGEAFKSTLVHHWRKKWIAGAGVTVSPGQGGRSTKKVAGNDKWVAELLEQIIKLKMAMEWPKKIQSVD